MTVTINPVAPTQGWECPKCNSVYAPWMAQCTNCPVPTFTSVSSNTITICLHDWDDSTAPHCILCGAAQADTPESSFTWSNLPNTSFNWSMPDDHVCIGDLGPPLVITRLLDGSFS